MAREAGIDGSAFNEAFAGDEAAAVLEGDLALTRRLGIQSLPTCVVSYGGDAVMVSALCGYDAFVQIISQLSEGELPPRPVDPTPDRLKAFVGAHPLVSSVEIREAFDLHDDQGVERAMAPLVSEGLVHSARVRQARFYSRAEKTARLQTCN